MSIGIPLTQKDLLPILLAVIGVANSLVSAVGGITTSATGRSEVIGVEKISFRSGVLLGSESDREVREDPGGVMDP